MTGFRVMVVGGVVVVVSPYVILAIMSSKLFFSLADFVPLAAAALIFLHQYHLDYHLILH